MWVPTGSHSLFQHLCPIYTHKLFRDFIYNQGHCCINPPLGRSSQCSSASPCHSFALPHSCATCGFLDVSVVHLNLPTKAGVQTLCHCTNFDARDCQEEGLCPGAHFSFWLGMMIVRSDHTSSFLAFITFCMIQLDVTSLLSFISPPCFV